MDILGFLYQLLIMPLQVVFEVIYYLAFKLTGNLGISIVALSFAVSMLLVPLYNRADAIQKEEREIEAKLAKGVEHIKKTFRGDEQLMMLQTYYRKNNYNPLYFLRGSLSLFLQIPFFIAAYQFLSNLELLKGVSFWFIKDLAAPDAMLNLGSMTVNVLPIIMTVVNLVSTFFFTKGFPVKTKIQLNGMALFFLVFLYNSPAGLLLYWTCNNIFTLVKNIISSYVVNKDVLYIILGLCGIVIVSYVVFWIPNLNGKKILFGILCACLLNVPLVLNRYGKFLKASANYEYDCKIFICGSVFLALLIGGVIPSAVIESSPQEFIIINYFTNPLIYLCNSTAISFGTFVLWGYVLYWMASPKYKALFEYLIWICCGTAIVNYMFFGKDLGLLTSTLQFENGIKFTKIERIINVIVLAVVAYMMILFWKKYRKMIPDILVVCSLALVGVVVVNCVSIKDSIDKVKDNSVSYTKEDKNKILTLSRTGKNIIVLMLDRAMGTHVPYIFNEKTELKKQFDGFTYYKNTISYGGFTNFGTPSLFGGYEYTPVEMNKRNDEFLKDKHNEALKVMPVLFERNGFNVTVCNPSYANYQWIPDITIYDEFPRINKYLTIGKYGARYENDKEFEYATVRMNNRNFYMYGVMKCLPLLLQKNAYDSGEYLAVKKKSQNQKITSLFTATGTSKNFLKGYNVLRHLSDMTKISDGCNTFIMMTNDVTHEPCLLQVPEYEPADNIDNTGYEKENADRFVLDGKILEMKDENQVIHYHANMAALLQLGKWFDYLRENNLYDNTRIIVVADHGRPLRQIKELILDNGKDGLHNVEFYFPLLLVKDFYSNGFTTSSEFMTNADVATIATHGVIENPINPFTGKRINNLEKINGKQYVLASYDWNVNKNNGKTYLPGRWYSVHTNIWEKKNWEVVKEKDVLPY